MLRVLVACEFSGIVRNAFVKAGHDAMSCDFLPSETERPDGWDGHYQGDVLELLADKSYQFDLMIAHPPCTHLAVSGARWFKDKAVDQAEALAFVKTLMDAPIPHICIENPISIISSRIRKPDQIIQPWQFGHDASKSTCLWLKNLPRLIPTDHVPPRMVHGKKRWANQTDSGQNKLGPSDTRAQERARTYQGIADAMATQWSNPPVIAL